MMTPDTPTALLRANEEAQAAFRLMLTNKTYSDPEALETLAYVLAERRLDDVLGEAQWEASKAEWDALQAEDRDDMLTSADDDRGNHYLFPEGVIEGLPEFNGSFK